MDMPLGAELPVNGSFVCTKPYGTIPPASLPGWFSHVLIKYLLLLPFPDTCPYMVTCCFQIYILYHLSKEFQVPQENSSICYHPARVVCCIIPGSTLREFISPSFPSSFGFAFCKFLYQHNPKRMISPPNTANAQPA